MIGQFGVHSSGPSKGSFVVAVLFFLKAFFIKGNVFHIYHNIRYQHRLRGPSGEAFLTGNRQNEATNHPKTRQKRAGSVFTACMSDGAHKCIARKVTPFSRGKSCFRRSSHPKTVNGDAIYCVAVKRYRRSRKTGFQHVQESGSSTAGNHVMASRRTTHHTIHPAIRLVT